MYNGPVIDCDVHNEWMSQDDLLPYLSDAWREFVTGPGRAGDIRLYGSGEYTNPLGFDREDSFPPRGGMPGSDPAFMAEQLLDPFGIERAILTYGSLLFSSVHNPYFATEVARAANDWVVDKWLDVDRRYYGSVLAANQQPEEAAKEIRRTGGHPRMAQVIMGSNSLGQPWGHPIYHPIYEAAEEVGIPVCLHAGGHGGPNPTESAAGAASFYLEHHVIIVQAMMNALVSFIAEGVFEKFPNLKFILTEGGVAWIAGVLWRFDANYKQLRREVPNLKKLPSEYFREHIRVTTQPIESPPKKEQLFAALEAIDGKHTLLFSSDYPHWDADERDYLARHLPEDWHSRVFYENAMETYGWTPEPAEGNGRTQPNLAGATAPAGN